MKLEGGRKLPAWRILGGGRWEIINRMSREVNGDNINRLVDVNGVEEIRWLTCLCQLRAIRSGLNNIDLALNQAANHA